MQRPTARVVVVSVVATIVSLLAGAGVVQLRAHTIHREFERECDRIAADGRTRRVQRDPAWGEADDDGAFPHYARAVAAIDEDEVGTPPGRPLLHMADDVLAREAAARAAWQPVLEALRAGARARDTTPNATAGLVDSFGYHRLLQLRYVANIAAMAARTALHEGRDLDAVRTTLDTMTLGLDVVRSGLLVNEIVGAATLQIGVQVWTDTRLAALDAEALTELSTGLEVLDRQLPTAMDIERELQLLAHLLRKGGSDAAGSEFTGAWRYGFSERWQVASEFLAYVDVVAQIHAARTQPWPVREALMQQLHEEHAASGNTMVASATAVLPTAEIALRQAVASVRMLRMAVDRHRKLDVPPLRDPLSDGPIVVTRTDDGIRLQCGGTANHGALARDVAR